VLLQLLGIVFSCLHLEFHDIASVFSNALVIANVNLLCALRNEPHVVRNHQDTALELVETASEGVDRVHIPVKLNDEAMHEIQ
jgi:hypothetical protein